MTRRWLIGLGLGLLAVPLAAFGVWLWRLPPDPGPVAPPPIAAAEAEAMLADLRPPKRARPLVAVVGINDATETTDYLVPTGILRRADVADVVALATEPGPVRLFPALSVMPDATLAAFDARHADGADYVIVPAMSRDDDPAVMAWLRAQAAKGAIVIGVCAGAKVVAAAGLLDGRRATTHWYYLDGMLRRHPAIRHAADRRMVADRGVVTTTGISASIPMMLTLVEAIAGRARAETVARGLGVAGWDARHASSAFRLTRPFALTVMANTAAFWDRDRFGIRLAEGVDEVSLALVADAWSRTYRSSALTYAQAQAPVASANGLAVVPDRVAAAWPPDTDLTATVRGAPADVLDATLDRIAARYGRPTATVVARQLEYAGR